MNGPAIVILVLLAQAGPTPPAPDAKARAQALLKEGTRLYEKGSPADALEKFRQAYAEYPSPKLWFNIGQANRDLGRPADAMEAFERFLAEATDASALSVSEAEKSVAELRMKLGRLTIECSMSGAEIEVDGKPAGVAPIPKPLWVAPGQHRIGATHASAAPAVEDVDVTAGAMRAVDIRLRPLAEVLGAAGRPQSATADLQATSSPALNPAVDDHGWWLGRKWTWVAAGATVAFTATATIFGVAMQSRFDDLNKECGSASQSTVACGDSQIDSVTTLKNTANIFWGLAGAAAVTTGILFFVEGRQVTVAPLAGEATGLLASVRY
jgi:hypothetical protein